MNLAPLAGAVENVDLHQGDWEHLTVLLDDRTLQPVALYTARHDDEGVFIPWQSRSLTSILRGTRSCRPHSAGTPPIPTVAASRPARSTEAAC
jgi:hypothetical protein